MSALGIHAGPLAVLALAVLGGACAQGLVGLGVGLVAAPVATLLVPDLMPELLLWLAVAMPLLTLTRERAGIDWRGLAWAVPARLPGTAAGVLLVGLFSTREIGLAVGVMVLLSVALTARAVRVPIHASTLLGAGFVSGVTGTATSIGGPPMALLYQHRDPLQVRPTLAVYFFLGAGFSLTGLAAGGQVHWPAFLLALALLPALLAGFALARLLHRRVHRDHLRAGVLLVCALSAGVLVLKSLLG